jgi:hypothetical protein
VTVRVAVPAGVEAVVVTVMVLVPAPVIDVGLKVADAPAGSVLAARLTTPVKPFTEATVIV